LNVRRRTKMKSRMKKLSMLFAMVSGAALFTAVLSRAEAPEQVPYPDGYRRWVHLRSGVIGPESPDYKATGGIHHIYANDQAMSGLDGKNAGHYPDGATIVYDLLEAQTKDGVTMEGNRRYLTVMRKDSKRFSDTGGWGFEVFRKDSHT